MLQMQIEFREEGEEGKVCNLRTHDFPLNSQEATIFRIVSESQSEKSEKSDLLG